MRYLPQELFVANTDKAWFDFLAGRAVNGVVDEVNFWQPRAHTQMKRQEPGEPILFRLKKPHYAIAGFGFFANFTVLDLDTAWAAFGWKNGSHSAESYQRVASRMFAPSRPGGLVRHKRPPPENIGRSNRKYMGWKGPDARAHAATALHSDVHDRPARKVVAHGAPYLPPIGRMAFRDDVGGNGKRTQLRG